MINKFPTIALVFDRKRKSTQEKRASVEIRIYYQGKQKYISTGVYLLPHQWKCGEVINRPDAIEINNSLNTLIIHIRKIIASMLEEGYIDIDVIPVKLQRCCDTFIDFCVKRSTIRKYGKAKDTQARYDRFLKHFILWGKIKSFEDINEKNIIAYDCYLIQQGMKPYSKWNNYHRFLNSFICDAIDERLLTRNPYKWVVIEKDKASKGLSKCLTPEEFYKLKEATMPTKSLERIRDLFVFQTYTCLSYSDLRLFSTDKIKTIKGTKVYVGNREKTKKEYIIPLSKAALDILNKYDNKLPIISNVKYNLFLKSVAQAAGIDKPLSTHWARHTGATLLLNQGIPIQIVSKVCGHSSIRITEQVYAKLLDETVVTAFKEINK